MSAMLIYIEITIAQR